MPSNNPINDGMMQLLDAQHQEKKAQLDLDVARAKRASLGRTVVPDVVQALQQRHLKAEKQRQQLREQGQAAPISPQALLPQTVAPTGMPGKAPANLGAASDLLKAVLGGGGLKRGGAPGAVANQQGPLGTAAAVGGSTIGPAGAVMQGRSVGPPAAPQPFDPSAGVVFEQPGAPAQPAQPAQPAVTITPSGVPGLGQAVQQLTPGQKWLAGLTGVLDIGARRFGEAATGIQEARTGRRDLGLVPIPKAEDIAASYAPGLAELSILRQKSTDPETVTLAEKAYNDQLESLRIRAQASGVNPDEAVQAAATAIVGQELKIQRKLQEEKDEEERRAQTWKDQEKIRFDDRKRVAKFASDLSVQAQIDKEKRLASSPVGQQREAAANAFNRYTAEGWNALRPEERNVLPPGVIAAEQAARKPDLTAPQKSALQKSLEFARTNQANASYLAANWHPEDYYGWKNGAAYALYKAESLAGGKLSPDQVAFMQRYADHDFALKQLRDVRQRAEAGAQIGPYEIELMRGTVPEPGDTKEIAAQKLERYKEYWGLVALRNEVTLRSGYEVQAGIVSHPLAVPGANEEPVLQFADMRKLAGQYAEDALTRIMVADPKMDLVDAKNRVKAGFQARFGLDPEQYLGTGPAPALR